MQQVDTNTRIIDSVWFTGSVYSIGIIAVETGPDYHLWKTYISAIRVERIVGKDHDERRVFDEGSRFDYDGSVALFPQIAATHEFRP